METKKADIVEDKTEKHQKKILVNIYPSFLTFVSFIYPLSVAFITFIFYFMEGRFSGYIPTISETGTEYPNDDYFGISMGIGAFTNGIPLLSQALYINHFCKCSKVFKVILFILVLTSSIGTAGLGFFSIHLDHTHHFLFAFMGFVSILGFELLALIVNEKQPKKLKRIRAFSLLLASLGLLLFGGLDWYISDRRNATITALGEYLLLFFMMYVMFTYHHELDSVNIYVVLT